MDIWPKIIVMRALFLLMCFLLSGPFLVSQENLETYCEQSGFRKTPRLRETLDYCNRLADLFPRVHVTSFGKSAQGRDLPLMIVDRDGLQEPGAIRSQNRSILLVQACIHPGESEGKDAGMMLVRDLVLGKKGRSPGVRVPGSQKARETRIQEAGTTGTDDPESGDIGHLLDRVSILFIPIFNVDGHERFGPYNRINQNGPDEMGWRVTATNHNLNRDFLKAETPEMQAWLQLFNRWDPDFFIDVHTTDGADYQYILTYLMEIYGQMDKELAGWCSGVFLPRWTEMLESSGIPVFPYVSFRNWHDPRSGLISDGSPPMLSQGYVALRNRPGLLIETHMLKSYKQRVESVYTGLVAALGILAQEGVALRNLIAEADRRVISSTFLDTEFPLRFEVSRSDSVMVDFKGVEYEEVTSEITGGTWFRYSSVPAVFSIPWFVSSRPSVMVRLPRAYVVPVEWKEVTGLLDLHGIRVKRLEKDSVIAVTSYRFRDPRWQSNPYEGRHPLIHVEADTFSEIRTFPAGSAVVETAQPLVRVIAHLLEPMGDGSLVSWGYFDPVFEQKEYAEFYVLEPMAKQMLERNPVLRAEFGAKISSDTAFARDQRRVLYWFYERSPYWDNRRFIYPVARIERR